MRKEYLQPATRLLLLESTEATLVTLSTGQAKDASEGGNPPMDVKGDPVSDSSGDWDFSWE